MKLISGILLTTIAVGAAWGQNPDIIQNTKNTLNAVAKKAELDQNAALQTAGVPSKPAAGTAAKMTTAPSGAKVTIAQPKLAVVPVKAASSPAHSAPAAAKPASVKTAAATSTQTKPAAKPVASNKTSATAPARKTPATKIAVAPIVAQPKQGAQKATTPVHKSAVKEAKAEPIRLNGAEKTAAVPGKSDNEPTSAPAEPPKETKTITAEGRRDPFISPVVSRANGPNCSTGKRCLAIDQILVRGVVKADTGMIAVVVNSLNKAYFLKENDPVYNGYVLRITGDSVVFKETFQDRLGKELTREVVKKITTPAV
jgi:hypothetical protein